MRETNTTRPSGPKQELRARMRAVRRALPPSARRVAARKAAALALRAVGPRRIVAVYLSSGDELATAPLVEALLRRGRQLCVPRLRGARMEFVAIGPGTTLRRNRHGIAEPLAGRRVPAPDAVILPLLAFDGAGRRLGQGGGHYDRTLARSRPFRHPLRIGYGYALQQVDRLPAEAHDVALHALVTDKGLRWLTG